MTDTLRDCSNIANSAFLAVPPRPRHLAPSPPPPHHHIPLTFTITPTDTPHRPSPPLPATPLPPPLPSLPAAPAPPQIPVFPAPSLYHPQTLPTTAGTGCQHSPLARLNRLAHNHPHVHPLHFTPPPNTNTSDCHNFGWWMDWLDALSVSPPTCVRCPHLDCVTH